MDKQSEPLLSRRDIIRMVGNFPAKHGDRSVRLDPVSGHFIQFLDFRGEIKEIPFQLFANGNPGNASGQMDYSKPLGPWKPESFSS